KIKKLSSAENHPYLSYVQGVNDDKEDQTELGERIIIKRLEPFRFERNCHDCDGFDCFYSVGNENSFTQNGGPDVQYVTKLNYIKKQYQSEEQESSAQVKDLFRLIIEN